MTAPVIWIRHGTCTDGLQRPRAHARPDSPLTPQGAREVDTTARHLRKRHEPPRLVIPSPLPRARQSAVIAASALAARLSPPIAAFTEWKAPHDVLGRSPEEYPDDYRAWRTHRAHDPDSALPGGESLRAFTDRALNAATIAADLTAEHGPVLIVSHRLLIGAVAAQHLGRHDPVDIFDFAKSFRLDPAHRWAPSPKSA